MFRCKPLHTTLLLLALLITGCATQPDTYISEPDWEISGKIGIREPQHSTSLLFNWQQQQDRYVIHLLNSLGQIQLTLTGDSKHAIATSPDGKIRRAATPETLLHDMTGWSFPVSASRWWLQGQPGNSINTVYDAQNRLTRLSAGHWQVSLDRYRETGDNELPYRLQLQHDSDTLKITLLIKHHAVFTP